MTLTGPERKQITQAEKWPHSQIPAELKEEALFTSRYSQTREAQCATEPCQTLIRDQVCFVTSLLLAAFLSMKPGKTPACLPAPLKPLQLRPQDTEDQDMPRTMFLLSQTYIPLQDKEASFIQPQHLLLRKC